MYALVDCNNFYATCERLFRPDLKGKPIVVLSNNDGCVVARSAEAKALGIKMGVPVFKIRDEIKRHGIVVFSSNYALYGDISARVMSVLESQAPSVEVYSIDEAFVDFTGIVPYQALTDFGLHLRQTVYRWTGVTVCVGIAPTKTLAKLANHAAKKYAKTGGVVDLSDPVRQQRLLALTDVGDVWGVGRKLTEKLNALGIKTALDLARADKATLRRHFSVVLERTLRELNGEPCLELELTAPAKQQILCSRSFGERIFTKASMAQAVGQYTVRATEKLRQEHQCARLLQVFVRTSGFNPSVPYYSNAASGALLEPSNDTRDFLALAMRLLDGIWKDGYAYAKAGVMLSDFYAAGTYQPDLLATVKARPNSTALMAVMDDINQHTRGSLFFARQGIQRHWIMKQEHLSPAYTTRWHELPLVK